MQDACIRDIIQADDTTFVMASGTSLALIKFENKDYLKAPFKTIDLIENDSYYEPIIKNRITRIYLDKQNQVLWVGTFGRGLLKLNLLGDNVNRIQLDNDIRSLNGIAEDSNGFIWLATDNKGIYKSQTKTSRQIYSSYHGQKRKRTAITACSKTKTDTCGLEMKKEIFS